MLKGRYITFLDSDDMLADGAIEVLLSAAFSKHAKHADIVQGAWITFQMKNEIKKTPVIKPAGLSGYPWGKVYRAEIFEHFQFPEGYWFEDTPLSFFLYYLKKTDGTELKKTVINDCVYCYRINPNGITANANKSNKSIDSYYITELCLKEFPYFGVEYDQRAYEYFLNQIVTNDVRIRHCSQEVREAVFVKECELYKVYFNGFKTRQSRFKVIEKALLSKEFVKFSLGAWSLR